MENNWKEKGLTGYPSIDKPWLKYYSDRAINTELEKCSMYDHIWQQNLDNLNSIAINYYGKKITYKELFRNIDRVAESLVSYDIVAGDIVTICALNSPECVYLIYALNKIGAVANMVNGISSVDELNANISISTSKIMFVLDIFMESVEKCDCALKCKKTVIMSLTSSMPKVTGFAAKLSKKIKSVKFSNDTRFVLWTNFIKARKILKSVTNDCDSSAVIVYTGGTTGGSKGVVLSNYSICGLAQQYILCETNLKRGQKWALIIPLFVAYGLSNSLHLALVAGVTLLIRIPMADTLSQLCKFKPEHIMNGPMKWNELAAENKDIDLSFLIEPVCGGDALPEQMEQNINQYLLSHGSEYPIMNGYGLSEVGAGVAVNFKKAYRFGTVGIPLVKNIISTFDLETGDELKCGSIGEICIYSPCMMKEYYNNQEETANVIRKHDDGLLWLHSGDIGYIDNDGFVHISGRIKRFMLSRYKGVYKKIFSPDIEKVLLKHPAVNNCAVVPLDDTEREQVPCAFIILQKDINNTKQAEKELNEYCKNNLEDIYRPVKYYFLEKFPFTKIAKVDYRALEKEANLKNKEK